MTAPPAPLSAVDMLAAAHLPPVTGPAETADLLVAIAHRCVTDRAKFGKRYWDALAERVRAGTYVGLSLRVWWRRICQDMGIDQPWPADQHLLLAALDGGDDPAVLRVLREETAVVVLRVRLAAAAGKELRATATTSSVPASSTVDAVDLEQELF